MSITNRVAGRYIRKVAEDEEVIPEGKTPKEIPLERVLDLINFAIAPFVEQPENGLPKTASSIIAKWSDAEINHMMLTMPEDL